MELRLSNLQRVTVGDELHLMCTVQIKRRTYQAYIATPADFSDYVALRGEAFVAAFLMVAMKLKARLVCEFTLDKEFLLNIQETQKVLVSWKVGFLPIEVVSNGSDEMQAVVTKNVGSFFSGGVDSFYTLLKNIAGKSSPKLSHLILVQGFDIELSNTALFDEAKIRLTHIAQQYKLHLLTVKTNIRTITDSYVLWNFAHGGALGAVAQFLSNGFSTIFVPSTDSYKQFFPWGSHPDLDKHWGSGAIALLHDGNEANRTEKIAAYIARSSLALKHLRVCYKNIKSQYNCGKCSKCLRSQVELRAVGAGDVSHLFSHVLEMSDVLKLNTRDFADRIHLEAALQYLVQYNSADEELRKALETTLAKTYKFSLTWFIRDLVRKIDADFLGAKLYKFLSRHGVL